MATNATVSLPADLGIEQSRALHALLAGHLDAAELTLSAGDVGRIHTATLQVLCAFVRSRAQAGHTTTWSQPSTVVAEGAARLGLETMLGLAPAKAA